MKPFIQPYQYHFIHKQMQTLLNAQSASNDESVLRALRTMATERLLEIVADGSDEQQQFVQALAEVDNTEKAEKLLAQLRSYVIPFEVTEQEIKKLFPKVKKLRVPHLAEFDMFTRSYVNWFDSGTNKTFLVTRMNQKLVGLQGTLTRINEKGICTLCNGYEEVGILLVEEKGKQLGTYTKRGNYICTDGEKCNQNITSLERIHGFIERLKK
ncbi:FusB/FusC family EF-G-binding protein [Bacillus solimangrovi]|uniref:Elongation factor G-binding protein n=1 Tax=Bacillus solimangrovi TaxID=1305675 RepID=A0A1E5LEP0_9BACI|nr:FusB/FusC family EF-G-binding protein [Bacillus solimangrovi]OEH92540.1 elongation factor G-binding protein [Bacillus solimangrovi]